MPAIDSPISPTVNRARKRVIRHIHQNGLRPGDRLTITPDLLQSWDTSDRVMRQAMASLVASNTVKRKRRLGTVVVDHQAAVPALWVVAVAVNAQPPRPGPNVEAVLLERLRVHLATYGCVDKTFVQTPGPRIWPGEDPLPRFPGLANALARGEVDAIITSRQIHRAPGQRICHVGNWEDAPWGVELDRGAMVSQAYAALRQRGARRIGLVGYHVWDDEQRRVKTTYQALLRADGLDLADLPPRSTQTGSVPARQVVEQLLAMPQANRPDGLIVTDDLVGLDFTQQLSQQADYRPLLAVQVNRQMALPYPLPIVPVSFDIDRLARVTVEAVLERLRNPDVPESIRWFEPCPAEDNSTTDISHSSIATPKLKELHHATAAIVSH